MTGRKIGRIVRLAVALVLTAEALVLGQAAPQQQAPQQQQQQQPSGEYNPTVGQAGKDVVWVPTSDTLVEAMLDLAQLKPDDYLIDLGSGDGRTVIAAARRGATALGIEYNPDLVALSKRRAAAAGVTVRASFLNADVFVSDFSKASVLTLFLLPSLNLRLRPQILEMRPGTRVVSNSFTMGDWEADKQQRVEGCTTWCNALLWIVPAKVEGSWQTPDGVLTLEQHFQHVTGALGATPIAEGHLVGDAITFSVGDVQYGGRVNGSTIEGTMSGGRSGDWRATRQ